MRERAGRRFGRPPSKARPKRGGLWRTPARVARANPKNLKSRDYFTQLMVTSPLVAISAMMIISL